MMIKNQESIFFQLCVLLVNGMCNCMDYYYSWCRFVGMYHYCIIIINVCICVCV